ncbi:MAG TPA: glycosyltransferase [Candidatus Coprousia avicola]|nr:glycosyltransferase [Candidatus Coprousia avicola]
MAVYAHINTVPNGSTGGIMMREHNELLARGVESYAFWGRGREAQDDHEMKFANDSEVYLDVLRTRLDGRAGFHSKVATKRLLKRLDEIKPDVVHLHNLHGYYINIEMLFNWLSNHNCKVEWTLHDCWAFTGHCAYFTYVKCAQWQTHCAYPEKCPQLNTYPETICKKSCARNFVDKYQLFSSIPPERMKLISPSHWLKGLIKRSFLSAYEVEVRHNEIDRTVFRPRPSDFRERYGIGSRFMILGVANPWSERKGLRDFVRLAKKLDSEKYVIVLVGLSKKQIEALPKDIVCLARTDSPQKLAEIYTAADIFFNPTLEDNYPTVNLEAEACGTPVVTYDTGGCAEAIRLSNSAVTSGFEESYCHLIRRK